MKKLNEPDSMSIRSPSIHWSGFCLHQLFEQQVARTPESVALVGGERHLTYRELNEKSDQLARALRNQNVGPDTLVGLCLDRGFSMIIGILGILKAGGAYVPVDPGYPDDRLEFIAQDAQWAVLVTDSRHSDRMKKISGGSPVVDLEQLPDETPENSSEAKPPGPENSAYVIYTSGSTGLPKGVVVTHQNVVRLFTQTAPWYGFNSQDVWTLFHSFAFDFSVWEIWGALLYGGKLVIVPYAISRSPEQFYQLVQKEGVTVLNQTPSAFRQFIRAEENQPNVSGLRLRYVIFGGEALELKSLRSWFERHGDQTPRLVNMYGITETTVHVTYRPLSMADLDKPSLIGIPIPDLTLQLLDSSLKPVPNGEIGEIFVGGAGVARGYLNRPELTSERFIQSPFQSAEKLYRTGDLARQFGDHDLEYCGRIDFQVKIRGHRVELGEIESRLNEHRAIRESAVLLKEGDRLVAYVVARESVPSHSDLREHLSRDLPDYMIPSAFVFLEAFPLNHNGKLDRDALPAPSNSRPQLAQSYAAPRDAVERDLAKTWEKVLGIEPVGIHDRFFELGGTSLQAAEAVNAISEKLGEFIYVVALFDHPTVAEFSTFLKKEYGPAVARHFPESAAANASLQRGGLTEEDFNEFQKFIPLRGPVISSGKKNPRAIFVLAPPRSGTTLFRIMLAGHPQLFAAAELLLLGFDSMKARSEAFSGKFSLWKEGVIRAVMELKACGVEEAREFIAQYEEANLSTQEFFADLQQWVAPRIVVEKSPSYALDPGILNKAETDFENPFYIHLVRHPYSMVRSFEKFHIDQVLYLKNHPYSSRQLGELVWYETHRNALQFLSSIPSSRQFRISFEDLTKNPRPVMEMLCAALELPFHEELIDPYKNKERKMIDGIHAASTPMGDTNFKEFGSINPKVAEKWKDVAQDNFLTETTWALAQKLGYQAPGNVQFPGAKTTSSARRGTLRQQAQVRSKARQL